MSYQITEECIACDACLPVCPTNAVGSGDPIYIISALLCTECITDFDAPQCVAVCPVESIIRNVDLNEGQSELLQKKAQIYT